MMQLHFSTSNMCLRAILLFISIKIYLNTQLKADDVFSECEEQTD